MTDFHLASYLIDEVQIGSVDSVSKLWEDIFNTFPVDSRPIRFEYITRCILTAYKANCDDVSAYNSRLSTAHKAQVALVGNTTITVDDDFSQAEMMRGLHNNPCNKPSRLRCKSLMMIWEMTTRLSNKFTRP